ncbi:hypothetical protein BZL30_4488 [Mycobacterium kansasii]|uniref:Uncharacterized protein n=1 Tax=Mycobacterium kansasii TaxID=1768 RepID=A0A1V3X372_MYCKA|nr:hypothetical protein BZL30_4488 [Mycobacterium kansasii]
MGPWWCGRPDAVTHAVTYWSNAGAGLTPIGWSMAYESLAAHTVGRKAQQDHGNKEAA